MEQLPGLPEWEAQFVKICQDNTLQAFTFYNVNPSYFAFDAERVWVLDGGVQLVFADGQVITFGWNNDMELMDMVADKAENLFGKLDFYELEEVTQKVNDALAGKPVQSVDFEWNWYQKMNEDFELEETLNFAPLGMQLRFADGETLQLAAIKFAVDAKDKSLANASYLPEGDLLVAVNEIIPITLPDDEPAEQ